MGWLVFVGVLLVLGVLIWRREHRGSRGGFAVHGERGRDHAHRADMESRTSSARGFSGFTGGGGPGL
jgi:hypothetical protein